MGAPDAAVTIGQRLCQLRFRAGLSQQELAARAGISVRAVRNIEQGRVAHPQASSLYRLAGALGVSVADLGAFPEQQAVAAGRGVAGPGGSGASGGAGGPAAPAVGRLRVEVLGPLVVRRAGAVVAVDSAMQRTLLGLLAMRPRQVVDAGAIVDSLWENPPRTCLQLVNTYVANLRRLLEPGRPSRAPAQVLRRGAGGYRLDVDELDLTEFGDLAGQARRAWADGAAESSWELYTRAWALWRGPVLAGSVARLRQDPAAVAVAQRRIATVLEWTEVALRLEYGERVVGPLRGLCAEEPLHEGLAAGLMLALAGAGQQAAALAVFDGLRARLDAELGVVPGPDLQAAQLRVLRGQLAIPARSATPVAGSAAAGPAAAGPAAAGSAAGGSAAGGAGRTGPPSEAVPAQLPADVAAFTGRAGDLLELDGLLPAEDGEDREDIDSVVIATISGMGGVGKTALAVHWAHRIRHRFPDGQLYVNLHGHATGAPLRPIDALSGFLLALGVPADRVPDDVAQAAALYRSRLSDRRVLVLLDDAASAEYVRPLIPPGGRSLAIVTSRDRMAGLIARDGARSLALSVLPPDEAVALLVRMLGARRTAAEPAAVAELARLCAYLPLALRIAAANLSGRPRHSVAGYVARLAHGDRLAALAVDGDSGTAVRATFELSYAALPEAERVMFRLLSLVPGDDITAAAAAALAGTTPADAERILDRLSDRHLVDEHAPGRYTLHDLLRLYGAELTSAEDPQRDAAIARLSAHYQATTAAAAKVLYPHVLQVPPREAPRPAALDPPPAHFAAAPAALSWLDAERANLVAMVTHLADRGYHAAAWRLADRMQGYFWMRRDTVEWQVTAAAGHAAAQAAGDLTAQAGAELSLGTVNNSLSRFPAAAEHFRRAAELARQAGWTEGHAVALNNLARTHWVAGQIRDTIDRLTQALALHREAGRLAGEAVTLANLAVAHWEWGRDRPAGAREADLDQAMDLLTAALALHRRIGDRRNEADTLRILAEVQRDSGDLGRALGHAEQALAMARAAGDIRSEAAALNALATIQVRLGRGGPGLDQHRQALQLAEGIDDRQLRAQLLLDLADAHLRLDQADDAFIEVHEALTVAREIGSRLLDRQAQRLLDAIRANTAGANHGAGRQHSRSPVGVAP